MRFRSRSPRPGSCDLPTLRGTNAPGAGPLRAVSHLHVLRLPELPGAAGGVHTRPGAAQGRAEPPQSVPQAASEGEENGAMSEATTTKRRYRCEFDGRCDAHRLADEQEPRPDDRYRRRPLPCRLGIHGHYAYRRDFGVMKCLVCGYEWENSSRRGQEGRGTLPPPPTAPLPPPAESDPGVEIREGGWPRGRR